jgi:hypothetical protein
MYGKQMYKGGVEGTVLANRSTEKMKFYDKDDLTKLFGLEEDGVCDSLENMRKTKGSGCLKKCSLGAKKRNVIVGISKRID